MRGLALALLPTAHAGFVALSPDQYRHHFVEGFPGPYLNGSGVGVVNESSFQWAVANLPLFDSSDADLTSAYYFRAKSYRAHLVQTDWSDIKHVASEFGPAVSWGGVYGSINAAAGHHISEGRWLRDRSYNDGLVRFWIGSQAGGGPSGNTSSGAFEPGIGHFANGTRGQTGGCAYSSWILSAALKHAHVRGNLSLGLDFHGRPVGFVDVLPLMVSWWESRSLQLRVDCIWANNGSTRSTGDTRCFDEPVGPAELPICYIMADGWDAMEGSVSGNGCRPTIGAMMIDEALAVATVANLTGNMTLGATFTKRASRVRDWYLAHLWSDESAFLGVYKQAWEFSGMGGCSQSTLNNQTDPGCCCVPKGENVGRFVNFSTCPPPPPPGVASPVVAYPGNHSACMASQQTPNPPGGDHHSSTWQCGKPASVRELLGLGPFYYHGIAPRATPADIAAAAAGHAASAVASADTANSEQPAPMSTATKFDGMWAALFDAEDGFWADWGPTTVERRATCFNMSQDTAECSWAGPSWPYETSRVLTGLARFLADYPPGQAAAGMTAAHYTRLLTTYARSMTRGVAANGSTPWVGENIEPDTGYWVARSIMYRGGQGNIDVDHPWLPVEDNPRVQHVNCSVCEGTCWDRGWSSDGKKCDPPGMNQTLAKLIGPCDVGCDCVPPAASYDWTVHGPVACCGFGPPMGSCDGKRMPTGDKDRGKDYNHSTWIDLIIEGLVGLRAALGALLVVRPLADPKTVGWFALDNVAYHGHDVSVLYDPDGSRWPHAGCTGLCVFVDGILKARSDGLSRLTVQLDI